MDRPDPTYQPASGPAARIVKYALQPLAIVWVLGYWMLNRGDPSVFLITIGGLHLVLGVLERLMPARPGWLPHGRELLLNIALVIALTTAFGYVALVYDDLLREPLAALREQLNLDIWPHGWPLLVQVALVFLFSEFIWYWFHRAEHRWSLFWRVSGHGVHHSFKHLNALNFGLNHPFEIFVLVLPAALVELTFGVGPAAFGAALLTTAQASIAHANLDLNARGIGWLFTTNRYHISHHSVVLEESNTNYGCSTILWDRVFGTFHDAPTVEAGTGPTEPTLMQKAVMPFREPADTAIAPK